MAPDLAIIPTMASTEVIIVGNEVLLGLVQDTNSNYLCRVVRTLGGSVNHIAVVADEIDAIADEIKSSLRRRPQLVFTCGGLGPTEDDLTLTGIGKACGLDLSVDAIAREFVARRYAELASAGHVSTAEMNESRLKMAKLPSGATMIENPVGTAPATHVRVNDSRIVSLPGVPAELRGIVEGPLRPVLAEIFGSGRYVEREIFVESGDESMLAPALRRASRLHPRVYIESHAKGFGLEVKFRITFSASGANDREAEGLIELACDDVRRLLQENGIGVL